MDRSLAAFLLEAFDAEVSQRAAAVGRSARKLRLARVRQGIDAYSHLLQDLAGDPDMDSSASRIMAAAASVLGAPRRHRFAV